MQDKMTILVTGAEGFIGSEIVKKLYRNYEVIALDYLSRRGQSNIPSGVKYINHDLSSPILPSLPSHVDLIIQEAVVSMAEISKEPFLDSVNNSITLSVLELARRHKAKVIFTSSCSVYGEGIELKETDKLHPLSLYAVGKVNAEKYVKFYHEMYGIDTIILRYSNVYGDTTFRENRFYQGTKGVVRVFMENVLKGMPISLIGGAQTRDFTFIDDIVASTIAMMAVEGFEIFNLGTGVGTSVTGLVNLVSDVLGIKEPKTQRNAKREIDNIENRTLDITKISHIYKPRYSLKEGLKEYVKRLPER